MPALGRVQLLVYAGLAVAVLLIGARWIRDGEAQRTGDGGVAFAAGGPQHAGTREDGAGGSFSVEAGGGDIVVHVAGAVRVPGVYRMPAGSRVTDAVKRAGGPDPRALLDAINLAASLADGQQVIVPERVSGPAALAGGAAALEGPISLGTATLEQLDTIDGIGPVTAQDILDFRDENGGLSSVDELDEISGIGPATMEALRDGLQP